MAAPGRDPGLVVAARHEPPRLLTERRSEDGVLLWRGVRLCECGSGSRALRPNAAARTGELLGQGPAHEALHADVVPHAELLQPAGDASRDARRELDQLLVVLSNESHSGIKLPATRGSVNHGQSGGAGARREAAP